MKGKLIKELHSIGIYRHHVTRQKLEILKTAEIIKIWDEYYKKTQEVVAESQLEHEGQLAPEEV